MQVWDEVINDPHLLQFLTYLTQHALEGMQTNIRLNWGKVTLSLTAGTLTGQTVTFKDASGKNNQPFKPGSTPWLFLFANPGSTSSRVTPSYTQLTNTAVQIQCESDTTQSVDVNYVAIGQV